MHTQNATPWKLLGDLFFAEIYWLLFSSKLQSTCRAFPPLARGWESQKKEEKNSGWKILRKNQIMGNLVNIDKIEKYMPPFVFGKKPKVWEQFLSQLLGNLSYLPFVVLEVCVRRMTGSLPFGTHLKDTHKRKFKSFYRISLFFS